MPLLFNIILDATGTAIRQGTEIKSIKIRKEEVKLLLFVGDMMLYIKYHKDTTKKLLELVIEFSKLAGCKINIQKSVAFLYTNNELPEREIKKVIHFQLHQKE